MFRLTDKQRLAMRTLRSFGVLSCIGVASICLADQTLVHEWRDANGVRSYSQSPPPKGTPGVTTREFDTRTFTPAQKLAIRSYLHGLDATALADAKRFRHQVDLADRMVNDAVQHLSKAERAKHLARAPVGGERLGIRGGGSRLTADYFERQQQLESAVADGAG